MIKKMGSYIVFCLIMVGLLGIIYVESNRVNDIRNELNTKTQAFETLEKNYINQLELKDREIKSYKNFVETQIKSLDGKG